jgi:hypothetical protein
VITELGKRCQEMARIEDSSCVFQEVMQKHSVKCATAAQKTVVRHIFKGRFNVFLAHLAFAITWRPSSVVRRMSSVVR